MSDSSKINVFLVDDHEIFRNGVSQLINSESDMQVVGEASSGEEALQLLAASDPRMGAIVEMHYFGGMTEPEIASVLGVSERTVRREWEKARLLLAVALK